MLMKVNYDDVELFFYGYLIDDEIKGRFLLFLIEKGSEKVEMLLWKVVKL